MSLAAGLGADYSQKLTDRNRNDPAQGGPGRFYGGVTRRSTHQFLFNNLDDAGH